MTRFEVPIRLKDGTEYRKLVAMMWDDVSPHYGESISVAGDVETTIREVIHFPAKPFYDARTVVTGSTILVENAEAANALIALAEAEGWAVLLSI